MEHKSAPPSFERGARAGAFKIILGKTERGGNERNIAHDDQKQVSLPQQKRHPSPISSCLAEERKNTKGVRKIRNSCKIFGRAAPI